MLKTGLKQIERHLLGSVDETFAFGHEVIGKQALPNDIFCIFGPLGAGKTTLIKGIVSGFINVKKEHVVSPTFSFLNIYEGEKGNQVYHFDLYRLSEAEQFYALGFEEYLFAGGICCIEWSERIAPLLNNWPVTKINLSYHGEKERYCELIKR